jgi:hypothetical protein
LFLTKNGVLGPDRFLKRCNELTLLDRDDKRETDLRDDAHQRRIRQGDLGGRRSDERVV